MIFCCFPIGIPLNHWISRLPAFKVKTFLTSLPLSLFLIDETFRCFFLGGEEIMKLPLDIYVIKRVKMFGI